MALEKRQLPEAVRKVAWFEVWVNIIILASLSLVVNIFVSSKLCAHGQNLYQISGFIDIDKIHPDACPALVADITAGEQGIIALAFGEL